MQKNPIGVLRGLHSQNKTSIQDVNSGPSPNQEDIEDSHGSQIFASLGDRYLSECLRME